MASLLEGPTRQHHRVTTVVVPTNTMVSLVQALKSFENGHHTSVAVIETSKDMQAAKLFSLVAIAEPAFSKAESREVKLTEHGRTLLNIGRYLLSDTQEESSVDADIAAELADVGLICPDFKTLPDTYILPVDKVIYPSTVVQVEEVELVVLDEQASIPVEDDIWVISGESLGNQVLSIKEGTASEADVEEAIALELATNEATLTFPGQVLRALISTPFEPDSELWMQLIPKVQFQDGLAKLQEMGVVKLNFHPAKVWENLRTVDICEEIVI